MEGGPGGGWARACRTNTMGIESVDGRVQGESPLLGQPIEMGSRHIRVPIVTPAISAKGIDRDQDHVPSREPRTGLGMGGDHLMKGAPTAKSVWGSMQANLTPGRESGQSRSLDIQVFDLIPWGYPLWIEVRHGS